MDKNKVLKDYLSFKRTSVKSEGKIKDLERYIWKFLNSTRKSVDKINEGDLTNFINSLEKGYSVNSINDIKAYLKNFVRWYFVDWSSRFRNLDKLCRTQKPPKPQSPEDMLKLKEVEKLINGEKDLMWRVYWLVFFYGGMRPNETCSLKWDQVFFEPQGTTIKIFSKKNKETFYKGIPPEAEKYLKDWKKDNPEGWVFPSPVVKGEHISPKTTYFRLKRLSKRVLGKEIYPYTLRRSIATIKYNDDNLKEDDVANQMGHSKSMKKVYVHLDEEQIKTRARKIWGEVKKYSKKDLDKIKVLEKEIGTIKKILKVVIAERLGKTKTKPIIVNGEHFTLDEDMTDLMNDLRNKK